MGRVMIGEDGAAWWVGGGCRTGDQQEAEVYGECAVRMSRRRGERREGRSVVARTDMT